MKGIVWKDLTPGSRKVFSGVRTRRDTRQTYMLDAAISMRAVMTEFGLLIEMEDGSYQRGLPEGRTFKPLVFNEVTLDDVLNSWLYNFVR